MKEDEVMKNYFSLLLNETNVYQLEEEDIVEGLIFGVSKEMVEPAVKSM